MRLSSYYCHPCLAGMSLFMAQKTPRIAGLVFISRFSLLAAYILYVSEDCERCAYCEYNCHHRGPSVSDVYHAAGILSGHECRHRCCRRDHAEHIGCLAVARLLLYPAQLILQNYTQKAIRPAGTAGGPFQGDYKVLNPDYLHRNTDLAVEHALKRGNCTHKHGREPGVSCLSVEEG